MNVEMIKNGLTQKFGRTGLLVRKHSPEILLGAGLVGMVATVIMASKATLKVEAIIHERDEVLKAIDHNHSESEQPDNPISGKYPEEAAMHDKVVVHVQTGLKFVQLYGPAVSVGLLSLTAILASHGIMAQRQVGLVAAYNLLAEGYKNYRQRVIDELGEDVDKDFHLGVKDETRTETVIDEDGKKAKVKKTTKGTTGKKAPSIYSRFFDESNPMFRTDRTLNKAFLIAQQNYMNDLLIIRGHLFLNEVYEALGFQHTSEGQIVGWVLKDAETMKKEGRDGHVDLGIFDVDNDPAREFVNGTNPVILIDPNVDGIVFDLI